MCGAEDLDVVYLVDGGIKYPRQRRHYPTRFNICSNCYAAGFTPDMRYQNPPGRTRDRVQWHQVVGRGELMPSTPCANCGLHVVRNADPLLKHVTCSPSCLTSLTRIRNGNKGSGQPCDTCGEEITTGRADSRYCSPKCRQKAYRQRVTAPRPEASPLTTAAGRRWPRRTQRKSLDAGMASLSGLCGALATISGIEGTVKAAEPAHWRTELAAAERIVQALHQKLRARSGSADGPAPEPRTQLPTRRKHLATGTAALSGLCDGLATVEELGEDITPELARQWQDQAAEALAGIRNARRVLDTLPHA